MQEIYNDAWYASNETRHYPLSGTETVRDKNGSILPTGILTDVKLFAPRAVYLSGVTCTRHLVSVVLVFSDGTLAAAVSIAQPVITGKHYMLDTMAPNIAGVLVFGSGAATHEGSWSFQPPIRLDDGCFLRKADWPVTSVGKQFCKGISGRIQLASGNDLSITKEVVQLGNRREDGDRADGEYRSQEAFVIRLTAGNNDTGAYTAYAPKCAMRPVNGTCKAQGILSIGGAIPDIHGNLNIAVATEVPGEQLLLDTIAPTDVQDGCPNVPYMRPSVHIVQAIDTRELQDKPAWSRPCNSDICEECSTCEDVDET